MYVYTMLFLTTNREPKSSLLRVTDISRNQIIIVPWYPYPVFYMVTS